MSGRYFEKLKDPRWQKVRLQVLERAGWACEGFILSAEAGTFVRCGATDKTFHVHHGYYERGHEPWDYSLATLWCLCQDCHERAQDCMRDAQYELAHINPCLLSPVAIMSLRTDRDDEESLRRGDTIRGARRSA